MTIYSGCAKTTLLVLLCMWSGRPRLVVIAQLCHAFSPFEIKPEKAQYKIVAPLPLFEADCMTIRPEAVQQMIAIEWALAHWDRNPHHSDYQIGLTVAGTCSKEKELVNQVMKFLSSTDYFEESSCTAQEKSVPHSASGLILPELELNNVKIFEALEAIDLPAAISSTLTSQFLIGTSLPFTFATAATIEQYVEVSIGFLNFVGSNWVSLLYSKRHVNRATIQTVKGQLLDAGIVVETSQPFSSDRQSSSSSSGFMRVFASKSRIVILFLDHEELLDFFVAKEAFQSAKLFVVVPIREQTLTVGEQQRMLPDHSLAAILYLHEPEENLTDYKTHLADVLHNSVNSHAVLTRYMEQQHNCSLSNEANSQRSCHQLDMNYLLKHMVISIPVRPVVLATYTVALLTEHAHERPNDSIAQRLEALRYTFGEYDPLSLNGVSIKFDNNLRLEGIKIEATYVKRTKSSGFTKQLIMSSSSSADGSHAAYVEPDHVTLPHGQLVRSFCAPHKAECYNCPITEYADERLLSISRPGEVYVVGLFDLRTWNPRDRSCGAPSSQKNLLMPLAFTYVLETFKARYPEFNLLPGVELGGIIEDSCSDPEQAIIDIMKWDQKCTMIGGTDDGDTRITSQQILAFASGQGYNTFTASMQLFYNGSAHRQPFVFGLPHLRNYHQHTFSLFPSFRAQAKAVVSLLLQYDWNYVSVLLSGSDPESADAFMTFERLTGMVSICISNVVEVSSPTAQIDLSGSRVIVAFTTANDLAAVLRQQKLPQKSVLVLAGTSHDFHTVVSDKDLSPKWMDIAYGALSVQPKLEITKDFRRFLSTVKPTHFRKTWFLKFWEEIFACALSNSSRAAYDKTCTGEETVNLSSLGRMTHERYFMAAVESWIFALDAIYKAACPNMMAPCDRFYRVYFDQMKDTFSRYRKPESFAVYNLRKSSSRGKYVKIGEWSFEDGLQMHDKAVWYYGAGATPSTLPIKAQCHPPLCICKVGRESLTMNMSTADLYSVMHVPKMPTHRLKLVEMPQGWKSFSWTYIFLVTNSALLFLAVCALGVILVKLYFRVVKGNQSLGICLLCGVIMLYATAYFFIFDASVCVCRVRYFAHSLAYSVCFGVLIAKATQLRNSETLGVNGHISYWNYWLLLVFIFAVQVALNLQWIIFTRPVVMHYVSEDTQVVTACSWDRDEFLCSQAYVFILLILAMFTSFVNRNVKRNYKESRWLLSTCLAIFPIWVLWIVGYMFIPDSLKDALVVVELVICATIILALMFGPKLYILLYYEPVLIEYPMKTNHGKDFHNPATYFDYEELTFDGSVSPGSTKTIQSWSAESTSRTVSGPNDVQYKAVVRKKTRSKRVKVNANNMHAEGNVFP